MRMSLLVVNSNYTNFYFSNSPDLLFAGIGVIGNLLNKVVQAHSPLFHESCELEERNVKVALKSPSHRHLL